MSIPKEMDGYLMVLSTNLDIGFNKKVNKNVIFIRNIPSGFYNF